ncbi:hypothetical protein PWYN_20945 [Paenibacillus wynnii]|uniref:Immunity MXAN-0049 protein domain-containing protein n=1 Tax=Paenibacillus wynnii TaxID=268407 RepID=A0A098M3L4_9BACL|nr:hypothetical protein PWYN_20945 [Paenibacillus wynnii]
MQHPIKNFYAVNVISLLDGLDYKHSEIEFVEGHPNFVKNVSRYAFKIEVIHDYPIFRFLNTDVDVYMSQTYLKRRLEKMD